MKRSLFILCLLITQLSYGQKNQTLFMNATTNGQTFNTCGALIYSSLANPDSILSSNAVGTIGYSPNEDYTITICSGTTEPVRLRLLVFGKKGLTHGGLGTAAQIGGETLNIYDGPNTSSPLLGNIVDLVIDGKILTSTNASNCITIRFTSDIVNFGNGFLITAGCKPVECITGSGIPPASDRCVDAPELCSIDGYCGNTSGWYTTIGDSIVANSPSDLYFGQGLGGWDVLHNSSWLKFTAESTTVAFSITSSNCANSKNGVQAIVYESDCSTFIQRSNVISQFSSDPSGSTTSLLRGSGLIAGKKYYLLIDGFFGNICDYNIKVISGVDVVRITTSDNTTICPNDCVDLKLISSRTAASYVWSVLPAKGAVGLSTIGGITDSVATFCPPESGSYKVVGTTIDVCGSSASDTIVIGARSVAPSASFAFVDNGNGDYSFTNTSTGSFNQFHWAFGDGNTSTTLNNDHTFITNGTYTIVLTINDSLTSCFDYFVDTIRVTGVASPTQCNTGFVMYPNKSTRDITVVNSSTGTNLAYLWNFGDGNTSNLANPIHTYNKAGPFYLCLTVDDGNGCVDMYCDSIGKNGVVFNKAAGFTINVISLPIFTGVQSELKSNFDASIYPNPASSHLTIDTELGIKEIIIFSTAGETMLSVKKDLENVNVNKLRGGIYFIKLISDKKIITKKFIKQ